MVAGHGGATVVRHVKVDNVPDNALVVFPLLAPLELMHKFKTVIHSAVVSQFFRHTNFKLIEQ